MNANRSRDSQRYSGASTTRSRVWNSVSSIGQSERPVKNGHIRPIVHKRHIWPTRHDHGRKHAGVQTPYPASCRRGKKQRKDLTAAFRTIQMIVQSTFNGRLFLVTETQES